MRKSFILIGSLIASAFLLSACNTVQGFGKDLQQGGQSLQQAAEKNS